MSSLVPGDYLDKALEDGCRMGELTLSIRSIGDVKLPSGRLVACDPLVCPETEAFSMEFPVGTFPVLLTIAHIGTDQRVAFAVIRFSENKPVSWEMLTISGQDAVTLKVNDTFGYPVDSGTGCFMDPLAGTDLYKKMASENSIWNALKGKSNSVVDTLIGEMEKTYQHTWSWLNMKFGEANLAAFSTGYGDGLYASYAGFDSSGDISVVVTDFRVLPFEMEPEPSA